MKLKFYSELPFYNLSIIIYWLMHVEYGSVTLVQ